MRINKKDLPKTYILKNIGIRDWLLIFLATVISTSVVTFPDTPVSIAIWRTFIVAGIVFLMLLIIDMSIYIWKHLK